MTCFSAKRKSTAYFDRRLRDREHSRVDQHLHECDPCASYFYEIRSVRSGLQSLGQPAAPADLKTRLQILASRERQVFLTPSRSRFEQLWQAWSFRFNQWMRPLTLPATGGFVSSLALSGIFALSMATNTRPVAYEVPFDNPHEASAVSSAPNLLPLSLHSSLLLNMSLDRTGHIQDFVARDASAQVRGTGNDLPSHDISLPDFPQRAVGGDISILVTPLVYFR